MINWKHIIVHHSLTEDKKSLDWQGIRNYHKSWAYEGNIIKEADARALIAEGKKGIKYPYKDIGYHFGVERVNDEAEVLLGRMLTQEGAHTIGMNQDSIGICVVGNYDKEEPPLDIWVATVKLCVVLVDVFKISIDNIKGHREYSDKSCPGKMFDVQQLIDDVARVTIGKIKRYDTQ